MKVQGSSGGQSGHRLCDKLRITVICSLLVTLGGAGLESKGYTAVLRNSSLHFASCSIDSARLVNYYSSSQNTPWGASLNSMSARKLIINADDFGFNRVVTDKIVECHLGGIITSTTLMVNMPAAEYAAGLASLVPEMGVGVHVNLTEGSPISPPEDVFALLGEDGQFPGNAAQTQKLWRARDLLGVVETEIDAQVRRSIDLGIQPTHCDSHHGIHKLPVVRQALCRVLERHGVLKARTPLSHHRLVPEAPFSARLEWLKENGRRGLSIAFHLWSHMQLRLAGIQTPDWKATRSMGLPASSNPRSELIACIRAAPKGVSEILLHPGGFDSEENPSEWRRRTWAEDTLICLDPEVAAVIKDQGFELISFRDL